jgi:hypothetical protein
VVNDFFCVKAEFVVRFEDMERNVFIIVGRGISLRNISD